MRRWTPLPRPGAKQCTTMDFLFTSFLILIIILIY